MRWTDEMRSAGDALTGDMRWWGWGDPAHAPPSLPPKALALIPGAPATASWPRRPVALERVRIERSRIEPSALARLREIVGARHVREDHAARVLHAAGKGYPDLVRLRAGRPQGAPDAIVYPGSRAQLRALLTLCGELSLAVVPFGGGTSVVGGVAPLRGDHAAVLALDMRRLCAILDVDVRSHTLTAQAGLRAAQLERALRPRGLTLGHFPQSFEYVSLGGCAATRSAGQASTGYGRFEDMALGLSLCAPAGHIQLPPFPASAAGPDLRGLIVGSEGTLGVIDELTLRLRPAPASQRYEGVFFRSFATGMLALRELAQADAAPDVARLSDERETATQIALASGGGLKRALGGLYLRARGYAPGCLAILGFEGEAAHVRHRRARALSIVRASGGLSVGGSPGEAWRASRFAAPYLRDELLDRGVMVETLETATSWSRLEALHHEVASAVASALRGCGTPGLVMCHVSHIYDTGASLYFTLLAPQAQGREIEQWEAVKRAAGEAIVQGGGTITHHHAIGRDHAPWLEREIGPTGVKALRALKARLDPAGIMNPGKLLPDPDATHAGADTPRA